MLCIYTRYILLKIGLAIAVFDCEREQSCFKGSTQRARFTTGSSGVAQESKEGANGSINGVKLRQSRVATGGRLNRQLLDWLQLLT